MVTMMEKKQENKNRISSSFMMVMYLLVSIIGIFLLMYNFNRIIEKHDGELTVDIDTLVAEKMNRSILYMQQSVDEMATVLSYQDLLELDQLYGQLLDSVEESDYISIGIVDVDGYVYGLPSEQEEMEKWDLIKLADQTQDVSISEPYRSTMTGKLVFTMFSPLYQQGERLGCLFVTYPLAEMQDIANSTVLQDEVDIFLVNADSDNAILCSGSEEYLIGNWSSNKLEKQTISDKTIAAYEKWEEKMKAGDKSAVVRFEKDGVFYTQVCQKITAMKDWYVVVRVPDNTLSESMRHFRSVTLYCMLILVFISLCITTVIRKQDQLEKDRFKYMSTHDPLTDVYNRNAFETVVQSHLDEEGTATPGAIIFMDVDHFKEINDQYGHDCGDQALIAFANCLNEIFGETSLIARFGGDEFVVLEKQLETNDKLNEKMKKLQELLKQVKLEGGNESLEIHYSAGIVPFPKFGNRFEELLKYADRALYEVKEAGRNDYRWYKE